MPIYAYACQDCGHYFEKLQRLSDPVLVDCPQCSKPKLKKQVTAAAFKLKGTGWYETDFKNKTDDKKFKTNDTSSKDIAQNKTSNKSKNDESKSKESKSKSDETTSSSKSNKDAA